MSAADCANARESVRLMNDGKARRCDMGDAMNTKAGTKLIHAIGDQLLEAGRRQDWGRAEQILDVLDGHITRRLKSIEADDGDAFLEFAELSEARRPELAQRAVELFRRGWPMAGAGIDAEQRVRAAFARREAEVDYAELGHASALAEYAVHKELTDIPGRVRAHVAALRACELMPRDTHSLAALAAATRHVPDMSNADKRALLADVFTRRDGKVGTGFLVSVAAMLIDMGAGRTARRVLDEIDAMSPNNRHTMMVRARLASMGGDKVEAEHLASSAFRPGSRSARRVLERDPGFQSWLPGALVREW